MKRKKNVLVVTLLSANNSNDDDGNGDDDDDPDEVSLEHIEPPPGAFRVVSSSQSSFSVNGCKTRNIIGRTNPNLNMNMNMNTMTAMRLCLTIGRGKPLFRPFQARLPFLTDY